MREGFQLAYSITVNSSSLLADKLVACSKPREILDLEIHGEDAEKLAESDSCLRSAELHFAFITL